MGAPEVPYANPSHPEDNRTSRKAKKRGGKKKRKVSRIPRISVFTTVAVLGIVGILGAMIHTDYIKLYQDEIVQNTSNYSLCWQNDGRSCTQIQDTDTYRFFNIPISVTYRGDSPIQNQAVIMQTSQTGSISTDLVDGLVSIVVKYTGSTRYTDNNESSYTIGDHGLWVFPVNHTGYVDMAWGDIYQLNAEPSYITWKSVGNQYPIVILSYINGTEFSIPFEDYPISVQSESEFRDRWLQQLSDRKAQAFALLGIMSAVIAGIGTSVAYLTKGNRIS